MDGFHHECFGILFFPCNRALISSRKALSISECFVLINTIVCCECLYSHRTFTSSSTDVDMEDRIATNASPNVIPVTSWGRYEGVEEQRHPILCKLPQSSYITASNIPNQDDKLNGQLAWKVGCCEVCFVLRISSNLHHYMPNFPLGSKMIFAEADRSDREPEGLFLEAFCQALVRALICHSFLLSKVLK